MRPPYQERFQVYVMGPNQDSRLANVAAGQVINKVKLVLDPDAPFILRARALRRNYLAGLTQNGLQFIKTRWTGPTEDYRQSGAQPKDAAVTRTDYVREALQMPYFGQGGNWKPVSPEIVYPPQGVITLDLQNTGASAVTNLTFYWIGVKLFPWGTVPGPTYPARFAAKTFSYPLNVPALAVTDLRLDQLFTAKQEADFVWRAAQGGPMATHEERGADLLAEVSLTIKDSTKFPFMNDYVHVDILFGSAGVPASIPIGPTPSFVEMFGTGPGRPGLFYPEFYIPKNHQFWYDIRRDDAGLATGLFDFNWNMIGAEVFDR